MAELRISTDKVCALIEALHELDGLDFGTEIEDENGEGDDTAVTALEESEDDPRPQQIVEMIGGISVDERIDLVALMLIGREDFSVGQWNEAVAAATTQLAEGSREFIDTLIDGDLAAPEYLEAGLQLLGQSCADWDAETVDARQGTTGDAGEVGDIVDAAQAQNPGSVRISRRR